MNFIRLMALFIILPFCFVSSPMAKTLQIGTSTSTENSGLLTYLLPHFTQQTNIDVNYIAVGTGAALKLGREGKVDVLLVHSEPAELKYMAQGFGSRREPFMFNDFIIVGKDQNTYTDLPHFFKHLVDNQLFFVSRGDSSGTHKKEEILWQQFNYDPIGEPWYIETGLGMAKTLLEANVRQAYTLIDRGTWLAKESQVDLTIVFENAPQLLNPYSAIVTTTEKQNYAVANQFVDWLLSDKAQTLIGEFRVNNNVLFKPIALLK